jgi:hypothetical protein
LKKHRRLRTSCSDAAKKDTLPKPEKRKKGKRKEWLRLNCDAKKKDSNSLSLWLRLLRLRRTSPLLTSYKPGSISGVVTMTNSSLNGSMV